MPNTTKSSCADIPLFYQCFVLYLEPIAVLVGAYYSFFQQQTYLELTHGPSASLSGIPTSTSIVLSQLANLYLLFGLVEVCILRATTELRVWRVMLFCLLLADVGHLYSVRPLGLQIYWDIFRWNAIDWGNIAFVYAGAATRICFLLGIGFPPPTAARRRRGKG